MTCFLTDARLALIDLLKADVTLAAAVKSWFTFGSGLLKRFDILPSNCPLVSVVPAELAEDEISNAAVSWPQDLEIGIATDGQDAAPCEELVVAALDVVLAANQSCLDLAGDGVTGVSVERLRWAAIETEKDARLRWEALITVRIHWMRR
jgi:hypothetical protein